MENYELAFRMQMEVPDVLNIEGENEDTKAMYGIGKEPTDRFGRKCLLARRLIEQGVRFVQAFHATWDSHDFIERAHGALIPQVDQPITALIQDLKDRGRAMEEGLAKINAFRNGEISIDVGRGAVPALDPAMGDCRPEVWVGAWAKAGVRRTARLADGWLPDPMRTGAVVAELADLYRSECDSQGKEPHSER